MLAAALAAVVCVLIGIVLDVVGNGDFDMIIGVVTEIATIGSAVAAWLSKKTAVVREVLKVANSLEHKANARLQEVEGARARELGAAENALNEAKVALDEARRRQARLDAVVVAARAELAELSGPQRLVRYIEERAGSEDYSRHLGILATAHRDLRELERRLADARAVGKSTIERIVLYIDDLDRCPPRKVVQVLETVHLLLALPLFAVVVGVDPRWLCRSLLVAHPDLVADPHDYLDKIFQFTFTMPVMSAETCAEYLVATAGPAPKRVAPRPALTDQPSEHLLGVVEDESVSATQLAAAIALDERDRNLFPLVAPLVRSSPRRAKRFGNVYRLVKARAYADVDGRTLLDGDGQETSLPYLMLALAIALGLPRTATRLDDLADAAETVGEWLSTVATDEEAERVREFLPRCGPLAELDPRGLHPWIDLVRPFTPPRSS
jgi:hypothetical protein